MKNKFKKNASNDRRENAVCALCARSVRAVSAPCLFGEFRGYEVKRECVSWAGNRISKMVI